MTRFGVDLAGLVDQHFAPDGDDMVVTRTTYGALGVDPLAGRPATEVEYPCKGKSTFYANHRIDGDRIRAGDAEIRIYARTLPPSFRLTDKDTITVGTDVYHVQRGWRDEAAAMVYAHVRSAAT